MIYLSSLFSLSEDHADCRNVILMVSFDTNFLVNQTIENFLTFKIYSLLTILN